MRYSIRHLGVPIGSVELAASELISAGTLNPAAGYAAIQHTVREGSAALLRLGFFGAASRALATGAHANTAALQAAAQLSFELVDAEGNDVPATFVNLIEPPNDERVVVLARLSHAHARMPAVRQPGARGDGAAVEPNRAEGTRPRALLSQCGQTPQY